MCSSVNNCRNDGIRPIRISRSYRVRVEQTRILRRITSFELGQFTTYITYGKG